eukprot:CAMPEP_0178986000 /NCGR_PEP_ID=MMETSP0795-20121207/2460_1 /TAXON_ID=88552 /ORGANISM="Amoebophrya sp., Strain Ameob2" /LENGTH=283 /DNA_ID=CAMNT_0020677011 /DNA_START=718 /DNA_END=1568 /DNA_ORIENTATION=-
MSQMNRAALPRMSLSHPNPLRAFYLSKVFALTSDLAAAPDAEPERTLVNDIGEVVHDVHRALGVVGKRRPQVHQVVPDRVDAPSDGDDEAEGVEGGLASLIRGRAGSGGGLPREDLKQDVQPPEHTDDESAEHRHRTNLAQVAADEHDHASDEQLVEEAGRNLRGGGEDEIEFHDLERDGDQPVRVSVHRWAVLRAHPRLLHKDVVPGGDAGDEHGDGDGLLPLFRDRVPLEEEEQRARQHRVQRDVESGADHVVRAQRRTRLVRELHLRSRQLGGLHFVLFF